MSKKGAQQAVQQVEQKHYAKIVKHHTPQPDIVKNCLKAFFVGGTVCVIGQLIQMMYMRFFDFTEKTANDPMVATLIFIACLLTGFGVYDKMGSWAGAGLGVPVTGFANAVTAPALEHKSEGFVLGVGSSIFKLAGPVIVFGVLAAFIIAVIKTIVT